MQHHCHRSQCRYSGKGKSCMDTQIRSEQFAIYSLDNLNQFQSDTQIIEFELTVWKRPTCYCTHSNKLATNSRKSKNYELPWKCVGFSFVGSRKGTEKQVNWSIGESHLFPHRKTWCRDGNTIDGTISSQHRILLINIPWYTSNIIT